MNGESDCVCTSQPWPEGGTTGLSMLTSVREGDRTSETSEEEDGDDDEDNTPAAVGLWTVKLLFPNKSPTVHNSGVSVVLWFCVALWLERVSASPVL